jgi:hypothetical protein
MSYAVNNLKDIVRREMFVVMRPKKRVSSWTLSSGNIYYSSFTFGYVTAVSINGTAQTLHTSSSVGSGQFYYDSSTQRVYIYDVGGPSASDWVVVTFELYLSTFECTWYRTPTDSTSGEAVFRGVITDAPVITRSSDQNIFGYAPTQDTSVKCRYDAEYLQEILYDATFYRGEVLVYHMAGDLDTANITKIFTGYGGTHSVTDDSIDINIMDRSFLLDAMMDNGASAVNYSVGNYDATTADPAAVDRIIKSIYGYGRSWVRGVCMDYNADSPTTSQNRSWAACTTEYGNPTISTNTAYLVQGDTWCKLAVTTHYTLSSSLDDDCYGIDLKTTVESAFGLSTINPESDFVVFSSIGGVDITPTLGGDPLGSYTKAITILYHILVDRLGLASTEIDEDSFFDAEASSEDIYEMSIPSVDSDQMPTYKDVVNKLLVSGLLRGYFNSSGQFAIKKLGVAAVTADLELNDDDIINPSFQYVTDDMSSIRLNYPPLEHYVRRSKADILGGSTSGVGFVAGQNYYETAEYNGAAYLHEAAKEISIDAYYSNTKVNIKELLGERRGLLSFFTKNGGAYELELGDTVSITRTKLPGYAYDGTEQTRSFVVNEIRKQIDGVYLVLDDQKAIEENSGDW